VQASLELPYHAPYAWDALLDFLRARAVPGVECVRAGRYLRTLAVDDYRGCLALEPGAGAALLVSLRPASASVVKRLEPRLRAAFDLDVDPAPIARCLNQDPLLRDLLAKRPGLRVPGHIDAFEQAIRAMLGQQITVVGARDLARRMVERWGTRLGNAGDCGLTHLFPTPAQLSQAEIASLGMPRARAGAMVALARRLIDEPDLLSRGATLEHTIQKLKLLPGFGPWTAHYVALRALRETDAFPASDVGLLRALTAEDGMRPSVATLTARAERWRPWRAYAAQLLWTSDSAPSRKRPSCE